MSTLPLHAIPDPPLPLWRQAYDRWQLRTFGTGGLGGGLLFGGIFGLSGSWITLGALRLVPFDLKGVRVPLPLFALIGALFAVVGFTLAARAVLDWRKERLADRVQRQAPGIRALADHPWNTEKSRATPWAAAIRRSFWAGFLALFLAPFAWLFFTEPAPVIVRAMLALFGLAVLWMLFLAARAWLRAARFGPSELRYPTFPLRPGGPLTVHWRVPAGCGLATRGHFTLRALEERMVRTQGPGRNRTSRTRTQLWSARLALSEPAALRPHEEHALTFTVPADAPDTWLGGGETVRYWELCVELGLDGLDFRECYLVPLYTEVRST